jgi:hypothetical protein
MKVICINDKNRPNEVPESHWVKEGKIYTVLRTCKLNIQGGKVGFELEEINLKPFSPYEYFDSGRFNPYIGPAEDVALEIEQMVEAA